MNNIVGIYSRLSEEDRNKLNEDDESRSIQNQKSMLVTYATIRAGRFTIFIQMMITKEVIAIDQHSTSFWQMHGITDLILYFANLNPALHGNLNL